MWGPTLFGCFDFMQHFSNSLIIIINNKNEHNDKLCKEKKKKGTCKICELI
jgi:hypothetical protein